MQRIFIIGLLALSFILFGNLFNRKPARPKPPTLPAPILPAPQLPKTIPSPPTDSGTSPSGFIRVDGGNLVDGLGNKLYLKGFNLGGWLQYEDWIFESSFANLAGGEIENELTITAHLDKTYGAGTGRKFFTRIRDNFITEADIQVIASLGGNVVRVPVPYWLIDDQSAFTYLDKVIAWGKKHGVYVIIDLHSAPGCQLPAPFCTTTKTAALWGNAANENRTIEIWKTIARRYRGNNFVAGYNLLGEPAQVTDSALESFYRKLIAAVREVDANHALFLDANGWALDSRVFRSNWLSGVDKNSVYALHLYKNSHCPPFTNYGKTIDKFLADQWDPIAHHGLPLFIGEYGGSCDAWMPAATQVLKNRDVAASTYFTLKALRPPRAASKAASDIIERDAWDALIAKLSKGKPYTSAEWDAAFNALRSANFLMKPAYETALRSYFE